MAKILRDNGSSWKTLAWVRSVPGNGDNYRAEIPVASVAALAKAAGVVAIEAGGLSASGTGNPYSYSGSAYDVRFGAGDGTETLSVQWFTEGGSVSHSASLASGAELYQAIVSTFGSVPAAVDGWVQAPDPIPAFWESFQNTAELP